MHEGEKQLKCKICDQRFSQKNSLKYHTAADHEVKNNSSVNFATKVFWK